MSCSTILALLIKLNANRPFFLATKGKIEPWLIPVIDPTFALRPNPIKRGYTAFGDSYAAGIGTGNTSTWGCRQGRFSYPDLIALTAQDIDFQNLACSGATVQNLLSGGVNSQVDAW